MCAFDLLQHNGRDLRELPLIERKARLEKLILAANARWLHYCESFDDGLELLAAWRRRQLPRSQPALRFQRRCIADRR